MAKLTIREALEPLGLSITPHPADPERGFGYTWRGRPWIGPYASEYSALKAAFDEAIEIMNTDRPFAQEAGELWEWQGYGVGWRHIGTRANANRYATIEVTESTQEQKESEQPL